MIWDPEYELYRESNCHDTDTSAQITQREMPNSSVKFTLQEEDDGDGAAATFDADGTISFAADEHVELGVSDNLCPAEFTDDLDEERVLSAEDRRTLVEEPSKWPNLVHGSVRMLKKIDGKLTPFIGTGVLIGPDTVLTAAHNLYNRKHGVAAIKVEFYPGRMGRDTPWHSSVKAYFIHSQYLDPKFKKSPQVDIAVMRLRSPLGGQLGYFGLGMLENSSKGRTLLNVTGYPGDRDSGKYMYTMGGVVEDLSATQIFHKIDTFRGQSGSGMWVDIPTGQHLVVGVHTGHYKEKKDAKVRNPNHGTRLNPAI